RHATALEGEREEAFFHLGRILSARGALEEGAEALRAALALGSGGHPNARSALEETLEALRISQEREDDGRAWFDRAGDALFESEKPLCALVCIERFRQSMSDKRYAHASRILYGAILAELYRFDDAGEQLRGVSLREDSRLHLKLIWAMSDFHEKRG